MFIKSALCCTQSSLPTPCETYHDYKWKYQLTKISKLTLNRTSDQVKWTSSSVTFVILDSLHEICSVGKRTGEQLVCVHLKINWRNQYYKCLTAYIHTAISRKVVGKNVHATTPKGNLGYNQYTVPTNCSCQTYFCCFSLALAREHTSMATRAILSNFFGEQGRQNHPQYLWGLSRPLFLTFLETAVYM